MRPIFTKLQKKRQRVSLEILDLLEDSEPSAKRVARWAALDPNRTASPSGFMSQYQGRTWQNPMDRHTRGWSFVNDKKEDMPIILTDMEARKWDREDAIWFKAIISPEKKGAGMASHVLKQIAEMGDKHKVLIYLTVKPFGNVPNQLNKSQLMSWYKRYGWQNSDKDYGDYLVRFPKGYVEDE